MGATLCKNTATPNKVSQDSIEDTLIKALKVRIRSKTLSLSFLSPSFPLRFPFVFLRSSSSGHFANTKLQPELTCLSG